MKKLIVSIVMIITATCVTAQDCSKYYPMIEGSNFTYTSYNKKGKTDGSVNYKITNVSVQEGSTSATMALQYFDAKGKEILTSDYNFSCNGNSVKIDFESLLSSQMLKQYEGMEMDISGTDIELPNDLDVGQGLADANVAVKVNMSGITMNIAIDMVNRKVEKKERITTPSGTYDCYVIYSENKTKMMVANKTFPSRIWFSEGIGMIKQESYHPNGKLINSSVLSAFSK